MKRKIFILGFIVIIVVCCLFFFFQNQKKTNFEKVFLNNSDIYYIVLTGGSSVTIKDDETIQNLIDKLNKLTYTPITQKQYEANKDGVLGGTSIEFYTNDGVYVLTDVLKDLTFSKKNTSSGDTSDAVYYQINVDDNLQLYLEEFWN